MQSKETRKQKTKERESRMLRPVASLLQDLGFSYVVRELPYFYNTVDVFATGLDGNVAVEMKVTRWKKAIGQARIYQLFAQKVYLSMPATYAKRPPKNLLQNLGIGLVAVEFVSLRPLVGKAIVLVDAKESPILKPHHAIMMATKAYRVGRRKWHRVQ